MQTKFLFSLSPLRSLFLYYVFSFCILFLYSLSAQAQTQTFKICKDTTRATYLYSAYASAAIWKDSVRLNYVYAGEQRDWVSQQMVVDSASTFIFSLSPNDMQQMVHRLDSVSRRAHRLHTHNYVIEVTIMMFGKAHTYELGRYMDEYDRGIVNYTALPKECQLMNSIYSVIKKGASTTAGAN